MGQATRTTKLFLDLGKRGQGGANTGKRASLEETVRPLDAARAFYVAFFLAHPDKLAEKVRYSSEHLQGERDGSSPPMNCSPGPKGSLSRRQPIPLPCQLTTSANSSPIFPLFTAAP